MRDLNLGTVPKLRFGVRFLFAHRTHERHAKDGRAHRPGQNGGFRSQDLVRLSREGQAGDRGWTS